MRRVQDLTIPCCAVKPDWNQTKSGGFGNFPARDSGEEFENEKSPEKNSGL
jgi:hypothetical protein